MRATIDKIPLFYVAPPANFINRLIITTTRFSTTIFQCQGLIKNIKRLVASYPWLHNLYAF